MRWAVPLVMFVAVAVLLATAPWRKPDPKHELIVSLLLNLSDTDHVSVQTNAERGRGA